MSSIRHTFNFSLLLTVLIVYLSMFEAQADPSPQYADRFTSGTILSNLWRKKRSPAPQYYTAFADPATSGTILSNLYRKKRSPQYYTAFADPATSGTILSNLFRKKRSPDPSFADGLTSGTILSNLW